MPKSRGLRELIRIVETDWNQHNCTEKRIDLRSQTRQADIGAHFNANAMK